MSLNKNFKMKKKELELLDKSLNSLRVSTEILMKKRGFYIYYNEPTKATKDFKIHSHSCGYCAWGSGNGSNFKEKGKNGVWIGPFKNVNQALKFGKTTLNLKKISEHLCVKNPKLKK